MPFAKSAKATPASLCALAAALGANVKTSIDNKTLKLRRKLGYDTYGGHTDPQPSVSHRIPGKVFIWVSLIIFCVGIVGAGVEVSNEESRIFMVFVMLSLVVAPSLLIYPLFRLVLGDENTALSSLLSAIFGFSVYRWVLRKLDESDKKRT